MALGAGKSVDILVVVVAFFAGHLLISPDRSRDIGNSLGELWFFCLFGWDLFHGSLLSVNIASHNWNGS
jgi:hypothetical protein